MPIPDKPDDPKDYLAAGRRYPYGPFVGDEDFAALAELAGQLAQELRRLREAAGLSRPEAAKQSGVSESAINSLEAQGNNWPTLSTYWRLARTYGYDINFEFVAHDPPLCPTCGRPLDDTHPH